VTILVFAIGLSVLPFLGREYIPYLEEGTLHLRTTYDPNISLEETISLTENIEKTIRDIPEVTGVLSRIGRGEVGSHAHFVNDAEILINLNPIQRWEQFKSKDELLHEIEHRLEEFPGLNINITQPIAHNLDELLTGVKAQLAIKLYGEDFEVLKEKSTQIKDVIGAIEGATDVQVEQFSGQNHIQIFLNRDRIARYGMNIRDIQDTIEAAVGGITLGQIYEEQKRFDIFLRFEPEYRKDIEQIENLLIRLPDGGQVPLAQLATIEEVMGPRVINRENNKRFITIQCNIRGRDIGRFVDEAKSRIDESVQIPPEYLIKWGGQFELQQQANRRFLVISPITLALVALLLFTIFYSFQEVLIILINIPLALTGGIIALKASGLYLSVPASIGFIAIFGIALEDGLVLISAFHSQLKKGASMTEAIAHGINIKLRPVLMTTFTTIFGVLPLLLAKGPGAEIWRPLATVVVGGLFTSTLVTLIVLPLVFQTLKKEKIH
jgi:cobalt-zinc-cadmium resistance protein CzcA